MPIQAIEPSVLALPSDASVDHVDGVRATWTEIPRCCAFPDDPGTDQCDEDGTAYHMVSLSGDSKGTYIIRLCERHSEEHEAAINDMAVEDFRNLRGMSPATQKGMARARSANAVNSQAVETSEGSAKA